MGSATGPSYAQRVLTVLQNRNKKIIIIIIKKKARSKELKSIATVPVNRGDARVKLFSTIYCTVSNYDPHSHSDDSFHLKKTIER